MNSKVLLKSIALCVVLGSSSASAQQSLNDQLYIEAGVVNIKADLDINEGGANGLNVTVDEKDSAPMFLVGYKLNDQVAIEGGIIGGVDVGASITGNVNGRLSGRTVVANGTLTVTGESKETYMLGGAFTVPVSESISLTGRAGMMWWDVDYYLSANVAGTIDGVAFAVNQRAFLESEDGSDPYFGLGLAINLSKKVALKADYFRTEIDDSDVDAISLRLSYLF